MPRGVREPDDLRDGIDRAEHVRHVRHRHDPGPVVQQPLVLVEAQLAGVRHRDHTQACALLLAEDLPRHDVRVMLHLGDDDLVAGADVRAAVGLGDEVDGLGRAADEDDLLRVGRVEEPPDRFARRLVRSRSRVRSENAHRDGRWRSPRRSSASSVSSTACGFCVVAALSR